MRRGASGAPCRAGSTMGRAAVAALALVGAACGWEPPPASSSTAQVVSASGTTAQQPVAPESDGAPSGYKLAWRDEFDGTSLDTASWTAQVGARRDAQNTADAVSVHDGMLTLTTYTEGGTHYTGFIQSLDKVMVKYGYVAAKVRLGASPGVWCAFWLESPTNGDPVGDPATAGTEIDVVENRVVDQNGSDVGNLDVANLNWDGYGADHKDIQKIASPATGAPGLQGNWHIYAVLWTASGYTYYLDGVPFWTVSQAVSQRTEDLRFSCEVQDQSWAGNIPSGGYGSRDASKTKMDVDWVHVWESSP